MCKAIRFTVSSELKPPDACHCIECRKFSGHFSVATDVPKTAVEIFGAENITWYHSSPKVRRGFCSVCGSTMFFDPPGKDWIGIYMGAFDEPTKTHIELHIYVAEKGDYYEISDGLPQYRTIP
jgi:hypothetical protein